MGVFSYRLASGATRWFYVVELPPDASGVRRQRKKRGFASEAAARRAEVEARTLYSRVELAVAGRARARRAGDNDRQLPGVGARLRDTAHR